VPRPKRPTTAAIHRAAPAAAMPILDQNQMLQRNKPLQISGFAL